MIMITQHLSGTKVSPRLRVQARRVNPARLGSWFMPCHARMGSPAAMAIRTPLQKDEIRLLRLSSKVREYLSRSECSVDVTRQNQPLTPSSPLSKSHCQIPISPVLSPSRMYGATWKIPYPYAFREKSSQPPEISM